MADFIFPPCVIKNFGVSFGACNSTGAAVTGFRTNNQQWLFALNSGDCGNV